VSHLAAVKRIQQFIVLISHITDKKATKLFIYRL